MWQMCKHICITYVTYINYMFIIYVSHMWCIYVYIHATYMYHIQFNIWCIYVSYTNHICLYMCMHIFSIYETYMYIHFHIYEMFHFHICHICRLIWDICINLCVSYTFWHICWHICDDAHICQHMCDFLYVTYMRVPYGCVCVRYTLHSTPARAGHSSPSHESVCMHVVQSVRVRVV